MGKEIHAASSCNSNVPRQCAQFSLSRQWHQYLKLSLPWSLKIPVHESKKAYPNHHAGHVKLRYHPDQRPGEGESNSGAWRFAVKVEQAGNIVTFKLNADEVAQAVVEHCRREKGMMLPEGRAFTSLLSADGQAIRKLTVQVKWPTPPPIDPLWTCSTHVRRLT